MTRHSSLVLFDDYLVAISPTVIVGWTYLLIKHKVCSVCHLHVDIGLSSKACLVIWTSPEADTQDCGV